VADTDACTTERLSWVFEFLYWADLDDIARVYGADLSSEMTGHQTGYMEAKRYTAAHDACRFWQELDKPNRARLCRLAREKYGPALPLPLELSLWGLHQVAEVLSLPRPLYSTLIDFMADWDPYPTLVDLWAALDEPQRRELLTAWEDERGD
jgi:hypothetical protein